jgi:CRP/FNR family transcriptional regulator, cyclic AMP receptor protein
MTERVISTDLDSDPLFGRPLFATLSPETAQALRDQMREQEFDRGAVIFAEGDPGDRLYLILNGRVTLGQGSHDGREALIAVLGEGDMFGELSLFDPGPRASTATAITPVNVASMSRARLRPWLTEHPEVAEALLQALAERLRTANRAMADLVFVDVPGRVAKVLVRLADRFGDKEGDDYVVHHELTQEELARLVGASRETVNKALADFATRQWIRLESRGVILLDIERLKRRGQQGDM